MEQVNSRYDPRWICYQCGDLDLLDDKGLCGGCRPEQVATFAEIASRVVHREARRLEKRWRIG